MKYVKAIVVTVVAVLLGTSMIVSLLCYGRYCCVAACLDNCLPFMSVDDLFDVVPKRFHEQNKKVLLANGVTIPYVGYFPSGYKNLDFKYTYYLKSIDRTGLFVDDCTFYFNDNLKLVCIKYSTSGAFCLRNKGWNEFVLVFSGEGDVKESRLKGHVINVLDLRTGESHMYRQSERERVGAY